MAKKEASKKSEISFVKSISVKAIGGDEGEIRVAGVISRISQKEGKFGNYSEYIGTFQARVGETYFSAPKLFVPSKMEGYFEGRVGSKIVFEIKKTVKDGKPDYVLAPISGFGEIGELDPDLM